MTNPPNLRSRIEEILVSVFDNGYDSAIADGELASTPGLTAIPESEVVELLALFQSWALGCLKSLPEKQREAVWKLFDQ